MIDELAPPKASLVHLAAQVTLDSSYLMFLSHHGHDPHPMPAAGQDIPWTALKGFCHLLGIPLRTLQECLGVGQLRPDMLGNVHPKQAQLLRPLMHVMGQCVWDEEAQGWSALSAKNMHPFGRWFFRPLAYFQGQSPMERMGEPGGVQDVVNLLGASLHGSYL